MPNRAIVQSAGGAVRMKARVLQDEFARGGKFQHILLLLSHDRVKANELIMTQELIADMLGVRREGVTVAAGRLQDSERSATSAVTSRSSTARSWKKPFVSDRVVKDEFDRLLG